MKKELLLCLLLLGITTLVQAQNKAFLGIYLEKISASKAKKLGFDNAYGSYVTGIVEGTSAWKYGIQPFDYIYGIDEYRVGEKQQLGYILNKYQSGDKATVHIIRKGQLKEIDLVFISRSEARYKDKDSSESAFLGIAQSYKGTDNIDGVRVTIVDNSTAEAIGMEDGDIIVAINDNPIFDWTDIKMAINNLEVGEEVGIEFFRDGKQYYKEGNMKSYKATKSEVVCEEDNSKDNWSFSMKSETQESRNNIEEGTAISRRRFDRDYAINNMNQTERMALAELLDKSLPSNNTLSVDNLELKLNSDRDWMMEFILNGRSADTNITIVNEAGRTVYEYELEDFTGKFSDSINSLNNSNRYFLLIEQGNSVYMRKIVAI